MSVEAVNVGRFMARRAIVVLGCWGSVWVPGMEGVRRLYLQ